jgi:hypothetical protein
MKKMKKLPLLFFILLSNFLYSQKEISLDNNISGILNTSQTTQTTLQYVGNNGFDYKKFAIDLGTNYSLRLNPQIKENEFASRLNLAYNEDHWDSFITYQINYSYLRKIEMDNWIGVGLGGKMKFNWGKLSLSYATLYQNTNYLINDDTQIFRHSIRGRVKYSNKWIGLSTEYYYQPNFKEFNDYIIFGTTKVSLFNDKKVNLVFQDVINYRSTSDIKLIHNLTVGVGYKFIKKISANQTSIRF